MRANRKDPESDLFWFQSVNSCRMAGWVARMAASYKKAPPRRAALVFVGYWCFSAALVLHLTQRY